MSSFRPLLCAATICSLIVAPLYLSAQDSSLLPARVDSIAAAVLASTGVPSATVAVVMHGQLAYAQAYGAAKLDPHMAATRDMQYGIGSISKQFTAACVLLLQQEGKLALDDPV
ncbi:MAG: serine hydrolase domain-containing protein, partial [Gemmatimonadaceae bacterium]